MAAQPCFLCASGRDACIRYALPYDGRMTLGLTRHHRFAPVAGPVLVVVMDGVGVGAPDDGNAVWLARTPNLDWLAANSPTTTLKAHGRAVGMPSDQDMGNSEVGHNVLGSGRVFEQGASLVKTAIESGSLFRADTWLAAIAQTLATHEPMHFIGLLSDGNVHSHIDHLIEMLRAARQKRVSWARIQVLLFGRDVPRRCALE